MKLYSVGRDQEKKVMTGYGQHGNARRKSMESKALDRALGKIKLVLAQKEMGEQDLAKAIGLTADEVFQILTRERKLEFKTLEDIAAVLGISMEFFFKEEDGNEFAKLAKDPRLTEAENAVLVERLSEMREAFIELLLKKRQKSHDRDFVAG
jgi:transcriptional regulator with XRE-family HTH domain